MTEVYKCSAGIMLECEETFSIQYFSTTEDDVTFGIKALVLKNNRLHSSDLFELGLSERDADQLITMFCENFVFPATFMDILEDMGITQKVAG